MTLRTPRRRISPRAKRKYRVIRDFFRRALGSSSQQDIKINSSIAVNVTDLKHKIVGIEHQLNEVSRHCHEVVGLESSFRKETENILSAEHKHDLSTVPSQSVATQDRSTKPSDTQVLYKPSRKSDESDYVSNTNFHEISERKHMTLPANMDPDFNAHFTKVRKKKSKLERGFAMYEGDPVSETLKKRMQQMPEHYAAAYANSSHYSLTERDPMPQYQAGDVKSYHHRKHSKRRVDVEPELINDPRYTDQHKSSKFDTSKHYSERQIKIKKKKQGPSRVDQDFIADIIRKQYKPKKLFGRKPSDLSQFSAPVCRDQEFPLRDNLIESPELCSCGYDEDSHAPRLSPRPSAYHRYYTDLSDNRSICDTRLYSTKRAHPRSRRRHVDVYNDSAYYDVVPVKEKTSPKSRRKFIDEQARHEYYREVPPSPRSHRPRLNLKAQHIAEYDEYVPTRYAKKIYLSKKHKRKSDESDSVESDATSEINVGRNRKEKVKVLRPVKLQTSAQINNEAGTMSSLQYQNFATEQPHLTINDTTLNKSQDTDLSDKTDKALCEIKDILQNFLQEIKKEASSSEKIETRQEKQMISGEKAAAGAPLPSAPTFNYPAAQCNLPTGFVPPFTNPCCYPLMQVCPMNCLPNGYVMPSQSCTCHAYATNSGAKDAVCPECCRQKDSREDMPEKSNETEELIKEIYKFVAQNPTSARKRSRDDLRNEVGIKVLTSRSVGGTSRMSKHDAKVGTPALKCYSKSCEAIGSRMITDSSYTNATHSDTVLEKLSLEATTQSDTELGTDSTATEKGKQNKFANMLRSIGLLKKKKKRREISETESSMEVDIRPRRSPPFRQEIMDYAVHGQEYFRKPPSPPFPPRRQHESRFDSRHDPYHEPRYDRHQDPGYDSYHDPRYNHHDSRYEDHHDHREHHRDSHYDSHYDRHHDHRHGFVPPPPGCEHRGPYYTPRPPPHSYSPHRVHEETIPEHRSSNYPRDRHRSPSPPYSGSYDARYGHEPHYGHDSQVPLCLREIEVKSTGTQSERKMSFFSKLGKRTPPQMSVRSEAPINAAGTQTVPALTPVSRPVKPEVELAKPALFSGWKKFQEKVISDINEDPEAFGYRTHKSLAEGDKKMRNAMLKKMFYKRNPFSPNNLIIRTLLGNDPSSFGEPTAKLRTRLMF